MHHAFQFQLLIPLFNSYLRHEIYAFSHRALSNTVETTVDTVPCFETSMIYIYRYIENNKYISREFNVVRGKSR